MKLNKYIGIAVMPMLFAACQNDVQDDGMQLQEQPIYSLSGQMDKGVNSRAQIQLGNPDVSGEIFMWNEGDRFNLYQGGAETEVTFQISSDYSEAGEGDKAIATFHSDVAVFPGDYVAVYPTVPVEDNKFVFELQRKLDFSNAVTQEEKDAVWKEYFKNNMFMVSRGKLTAEGPNAIQFQHQCALARITYHNESGKDQVLDYVRLGGQNQFWGTWSKQNMDGKGGSGSITSWYDVYFNGLQVAAGDSTDIYMFFFPAEINPDGIVEINFSVQGSGERGVSLPAADIAAANGGAKRFQEGMRYWFDVTSTRNGMTFTKNYSAAPITFENVELSAALQGVLGSDMITIDPETGFGTMIESDVLYITNLDFGFGNYRIPSLAGIENFKNLTYLRICDSGVTECDLSQNVHLREAHLRNNDLKSMDFSNNMEIQDINLGWNQNLVSLNINNCHKLYCLVLDRVPLKDLNFPNKENITYLQYWAKSLSLDLEEFPNLISLGLADAGLTSLDIIPEGIRGQLEMLDVLENQLTEIDLTQYPELTGLYCGHNQLKSLDLSAVPNLWVLHCSNNYISYLDISPLNRVNSLFIGNQNDDITLIVKMTDEQKKRWYNDWVHWGDNGRTYPEGEEPVEEGGGSLGNFGSGGEF